MSEHDAPIRDAASVILLRDAQTAPRVLMGQRGAGAAFMPSKFVFPGGAVDTGDHAIPVGAPLHPTCAARLASDAACRPDALAAAAIRELREETGLLLGTPGSWPGSPPPDWADFARAGLLPAPQRLTYIFRAITPPGRPRRFDARFFVTEAQHVTGDPDDFSHACDELSHLQWIPLEQVRRLDLPFITEVVLAELAAMLRDGAPPPSVPFFDNSPGRSEFRRIF